MTRAGIVSPVAWLAVLALLETTAVALLAWAWSRWRRRDAPMRSLVMTAGLVGCAAVTASSAAFILAAPRSSTPPLALVSTSTDPSIASAATARSHMEASGLRLAPSVRRPMLIGIALGWLAVAGVRLGRFLGGLAAVGALRGRARPIEAARLQAVADAVAERFRLARRIEWLESSEVDAPAAVGWRRPAVLLPESMRTTPTSLLEPLVAHEVEHVRRNDWLAGVCTAGIEAVLFHCPGARWLASEARVAREEACDDAAVRACGEPARCAEALASLVGVTRPATALGAKGDGGRALAARVRRLLKGEDPMKRPSVLKTIVVVSSVPALAVAAAWVAAAALADTARESAPPTAGPGARPPSGYVPALPNAPATLHRPVSDGRYVFQAARVRNVSETRVTGLRFAALRPGARAEDSVRVVESGVVPASLAPGEAADLRLDLLPIEDLADESGARSQPLLAVVEVRFADGDAWAITIDRKARTAQDALYLDRGSVSRSLLGAPARTLGGECLDHRGAGYSRGAILPVLGSSDEWASCEGGVWRPHAKPEMSDRRE